MSYTDSDCMELAFKVASKSRMEDDGVHPYVGAVLVHKDRRITAYRGEKALGDHAEYTVLAKKLKGHDVTDATVYTTLEPCTTRHHPKVPCAQRLIDSKVARVVIGMLDPNQDICGRGVRRLRKHGVAVEFFSTKWMKKVEAQNQEPDSPLDSGS